MEENGELPDHLRCKRTDGREWRCSRRVMEDKKLCEIHHLQGRHRQYKKKVPESLKLQRKNRKSADNVEAVTGIRANKEERVSKLAKKPMKRKKLIGESEAVDEVVKKMRLKRGDLQLELIRMVLKREVDKRKKKRKKKKKKQNNKKGGREAIVIGGDQDNDNEYDNGNGNDSSSTGHSEGELMRDLPNGLMAISPAKIFGNVASCSSSPCDIKIGADFNTVTRRCFRSKNIEPMPIGTLQVMPKLRKGKRRKCHWCRRSGLRTLIRCSSCQKEFYCLDCIKNQ